MAMLEKKPGMLKPQSTSSLLVDSFQPVDEAHVIRSKSELALKFPRNEGHYADMVEFLKCKRKFVVVEVLVIRRKRIARLLVSDRIR